MAGSRQAGAVCSTELSYAGTELHLGNCLPSRPLFQYPTYISTQAKSIHPMTKALATEAARLLIHISKSRFHLVLKRYQVLLVLAESKHTHVQSWPSGAARSDVYLSLPRGTRDVTKREYVAGKMSAPRRYRQIAGGIASLSASHGRDGAHTSSKGRAAGSSSRVRGRAKELNAVFLPAPLHNRLIIIDALVDIFLRVSLLCDVFHHISKLNTGLIVVECVPPEHLEDNGGCVWWG